MITQPSSNLALGKSDWKSNVSKAKIHTGWYSFLVRSRTEEKVRKWLDAQLRQNSESKQGLQDALIPFLHKDVVQGTQTTEEIKNLWIVFAKAYNLEDIEKVLGTVDYKEKRRAGILRAFPVKDSEVYKMMENSGTAFECYKIGDTVMVDDGNQIEYQITDITESEATLVAHLFNQPVYRKVEIVNLFHVGTKKGGARTVE